MPQAEMEKLRIPQRAIPGQFRCGGTGNGVIVFVENTHGVCPKERYPFFVFTASPKTVCLLGGAPVHGHMIKSGLVGQLRDYEICQQGAHRLRCLFNLFFQSVRD